MTKNYIISNLHNLLHAMELLPEDTNIIYVDIDQTRGYSSDAKIFLHTGFDRFVEDHKLLSERVPYGNMDKVSVTVNGVEVFCLVDKQEQEVDTHD